MEPTFFLVVRQSALGTTRVSGKGNQDHDGVCLLGNNGIPSTR